MSLTPERLTRDWLAARVARMVEEDGPLDPAESLMLYGMDSMQVMELALELEAAGLTISFADLAETPTLNAWAALLAARPA